MRNVRRVVLLVNGQEPVRAAHRHALEERGYTVMEASDIDGALRLAELVLPDALVAELADDAQPTLAAVSRLKASPRTRHVAVVALSASDQDAARLAALGHGCSALLVEPVAADKLVAELEARIGSPEIHDH